MSTIFEVAVCKIHHNKDLETCFRQCASLICFVTFFLDTWPMNDKKANNVMSGVTKLTVIFDETNHKITIFSIFCTETTPICSDFVDRTSAKSWSRQNTEMQLYLVREVRKCQEHCINL